MREVKGEGEGEEKNITVRPDEEREDYMQLVSLYFHSIIYVQLHYLLLIHLLDGYEDFLEQYMTGGKEI